MTVFHGAASRFAVRFAARRAVSYLGGGPVTAFVASRAVSRAVGEVVRVRRTSTGKTQLRAEVAGFSAGVTVPATFDSLGDLPL